MKTFISETYLKSQTAIYDSVDAKDLLPHLLRAQEMQVQPLLGTKLYLEMQNALNSGSLSPDQSALLRYIEPVVAHYTLYYAYPFCWAKFTNKGIVNKGSDHSNPVDLRAMQYLREEAKNTAEFHAQRLMDYLKDPDNRSKYPSYWDANKPVLPNKSNNAYSSGWYMPD